MRYTPDLLEQINANIATAVAGHSGDLSRFVDWMGADRFAAKRDGRAQWRACELMLLALEMGVRPSRLVEGGS